NVHEKIGPKVRSFVHHRQLDLKLMLDSAQTQFPTETLLINRFEQARPQYAMDLNRCSNHLLRDGIPRVHFFSPFFFFSVCLLSVYSVPLWFVPSEVGAFDKRLFRPRSSSSLPSPRDDRVPPLPGYRATAPQGQRVSPVPASRDPSLETRRRQTSACTLQ